MQTLGIRMLRCLEIQCLVTGWTVSGHLLNGFLFACVHIMCLYEYTLLEGFKTDQLERRKRVRPLVPFTFQRSVFSVLIGVAGHVQF